MNLFNEFPHELRKYKEVLQFQKRIIFNNKKRNNYSNTNIYGDPYLNNSKPRNRSFIINDGSNYFRRKNFYEIQKERCRELSLPKSHSLNKTMSMC